VSIEHPPACRLPSAAASLTALHCFALLWLPSCLSTPLKYSRIRRENYLSVLGRNCSFKFFLPLAHSFVSKLSVPTTTPSSKCDRIRQQIFFPLQLEILLTSRSSLVPWKQRLWIYLAVIAASNSSYLSLTALCPSFLCLLLLLHQSVIEFGNNFFLPCRLKFFLPLAAAWCPGSSAFGFEFLTRAACSNTVSSTGWAATELYLHYRQIDSTHLQLVSRHPY